MKNVMIIFSMICAFFLVACNAKTELKLDTMVSKIEALEVDGNKVYESNRLMEMDEFINKYGIHSDAILDVQAYMPYQGTKADMYVIVRAKSGKLKEVKKEMETFFQKYLEEWKLYYPESVPLIQNKYVKTQENDYIAIVSEHSKLIYQTMIHS